MRSQEQHSIEGLNLNKALKVGRTGPAIEIVCRTENNAVAAIFDTLTQEPPAEELRRVAGWMLCTCCDHDPTIKESVSLFDERLRQLYGPTDSIGMLSFIGCEIRSTAEINLLWTAEATAYLIRDGKIIESLASALTTTIEGHLGGRALQSPDVHLGHVTWELCANDRVVISTEGLSTWLSLDRLEQLAVKGPCGLAAETVSAILSSQSGHPIPLMILEFDPSEEQAHIDSLGLAEDGGYFVDALLGLEDTLSSLLPEPIEEEEQGVTEPLTIQRQHQPSDPQHVLYLAPSQSETKPPTTKRAEPGGPSTPHPLALQIGVLIVVVLLLIGGVLIVAL